MLGDWCTPEKGNAIVEAIASYQAKAQQANIKPADSSAKECSKAEMSHWVKEWMIAAQYMSNAKSDPNKSPVAIYQWGCCPINSIDDAANSDINPPTERGARSAERVFSRYWMYTCGTASTLCRTSIPKFPKDIVERLYSGRVLEVCVTGGFIIHAMDRKVRGSTNTFTMSLMRAIYGMLRLFRVPGHTDLILLTYPCSDRSNPNLDFEKSAQHTLALLCRQLGESAYFKHLTLGFVNSKYLQAIREITKESLTLLVQTFRDMVINMALNIKAGNNPHVSITVILQQNNPLSISQDSFFLNCFFRELSSELLHSGLDYYLSFTYIILHRQMWRTVMDAHPNERQIFWDDHDPAAAGLSEVQALRHPLFIRPEFFAPLNVKGLQPAPRQLVVADRSTAVQGSSRPVEASSGYHSAFVIGSRPEQGRSNPEASAVRPPARTSTGDRSRQGRAENPAQASRSAIPSIGSGRGEYVEEENVGHYLGYRQPQPYLGLKPRVPPPPPEPPARGYGQPPMEMPRSGSRTGVVDISGSSRGRGRGHDSHGRGRGEREMTASPDPQSPSPPLPPTQAPPQGRSSREHPAPPPATIPAGRGRAPSWSQVAQNQPQPTPSNTQQRPPQSGRGRGQQPQPAPAPDPLPTLPAGKGKVKAPASSTNPAAQPAGGMGRGRAPSWSSLLQKPPPAPPQAVPTQQVRPQAEESETEAFAPAPAPAPAPSRGAKAAKKKYPTMKEIQKELEEKRKRGDRA